MKHRVYIDENPHLADTSARLMRGEFDSREEALALAREIVDDCLAESRRDGMTANQLLEAFVTVGEQPFLLPDDEHAPFDALEYATVRCHVLCGD